MTRILHISDLHFGRLHTPALESLERYINAQEKSFEIIVASGDWTQRARPTEFAEAARWISRRKTPLLGVPGNHDVPLYNLFARFVDPYKNYDHFIRPNTLNQFTNADVCIVGLNTVDPSVWKDGCLNKKETERARDLFSKAPETAVRVLVSHHSLLDLHVSNSDILALDPHLSLSGHVHVSSSKTIQSISGHKIIHVSAGSVFSSRLRGEANSFNIIEIDLGKMNVQTLRLNENGFTEVVKDLI